MRTRHLRRWGECRGAAGGARRDRWDLCKPGCSRSGTHRLGISFEDLGEKQVKNIARPVRAYRALDLGASAAKGISPKFVRPHGRTDTAIDSSRAARQRHPHICLHRRCLPLAAFCRLPRYPPASDRTTCVTLVSSDSPHAAREGGRSTKRRSWRAGPIAGGERLLSC